MPNELKDSPEIESSGKNGANGSDSERPWLIRSGSRAVALGRLGAKATQDYFAAKLKAPDIRRLRARMDDLERMMASRPEAQAYDQLSRSYERLFKVWVYLAGLPGPGVKRNAPERTGARSGVIDIEPEALPDAAIAKNPLDSLSEID